MVDVVIVGGGPAGLNAAVLLGRARRDVLLLDTGQGRNARATEVHNLLSRDGTPPDALRKAARADIDKYPTIVVSEHEVTGVAGQRGEFTVVADREVSARRVLLATGLIDQLPAIEGLAAGWGSTVLHCPYCHGYEVRDRPLAVLATDFLAVVKAVRLASGFSSDVVACTAGEPLDDGQRAMLAGAGITIEEQEIVRFAEAGDGCVIEFADGRSLDRAALFVHPEGRQATPFAQQLGCELLPDGAVKVDDIQQTTAPGVFAAGDLARRESMLLGREQVGVAAAAGLVAAVAIDQDLTFAP